MASLRALLFACAAAALLAPSGAFTCTGFNPVFLPSPLGVETSPRVTKQQIYSLGAAGGAAESDAELDFPRARTEHSHNHGHDHGHGHGHTHHFPPAPRALARRAAGAGAPAPALALRPFALDAVSLAPGSLLARKAQVNNDYIASLDVDSLLLIFRNTAGLDNRSAAPFGGWEAPDCLLRGHFAGHWLSASAMAANATRNATIAAHAAYVVAELAKCQDADAALYGPAPGYLSGFPASQFDDLENLVPYPKQWSPYYTIHKIMAGLRDQYVFLGNAAALQIAERMASYFAVRVKNVIAKGTIALWHAIQNQEFGGMNEVLYDLYELTGNASYAEFATLFDKGCFLGPLALDDDDLDTMHANAHEPVVVGAAKRFELFGEPAFGQVAVNFQHALTGDHAYATGNGNHGEYWGLPGRLGDTLDGDTQESCTSYNLLKLDRHLLGWKAEVEYADHYERLFFNGIMPTQNVNRIGALIYMLPLSTVNGSSKGFSDPLYSMTCCVGTGAETHAKLADGLFLRQDDAAAAPSGASTLAVVHYHSSSVLWQWPAPGAALLNVTQVADWDNALLELRVTLTVLVVSGATAAPTATIALRVPSWCDAASGGVIAVNGAPADGSPFAPLSWAAVTRAWALGDAGDVLTARFAFAPLRLEAVHDDRAEYASTMAVLSGPMMLVAPSQRGSALVGDAARPASFIRPVTAAERAAALSLAAGGGASNLFVSHDENGAGAAFALSVAGVDDATRGTQGADSTFSLVSPGLAGAGTISLAAANWPSYFVCAAAGAVAGAPLSLLDPATTANNVTAAECSFAAQSPGLSGAAGSVSYSLPGASPALFVSWFGGGTQLRLQPQSADPSFASMTSFAPQAPNWPLPPFSFVASAPLAARASGATRDFIMYPIAFAVEETYVSYFQVSPAA